MADLSITAANVQKGANSIFSSGIAGVDITPMQPLYLDSAAGTYKLADANASSAAATVVCVSLNTAATGQPVTFATEDDDITVGATLDVTKIYVLSATAGKICPSTDLTTGMYPNVLLVPKSTTKAVFKIVNQVSAALP